MSYESRLKAIGIPTLGHRRRRGDLIQYFKFVKGFNKVSWVRTPVTAPSLSTNGPAGAIRGHNIRAERQIVRNCSQRHDFFSNRGVPDWNSLPQSVIEAKTVNAFKNALDTYFSETNSIYVY